MSVFTQRDIVIIMISMQQEICSLKMAGGVVPLLIMELAVFFPKLDNRFM